MPITKPYTVEQQMARFGIPETEAGPYVTALRAMIVRKLAEGMIYMSAGSCTEAFYDLPYEGQAKERLAWDWELEHSHSHRVEAIDGVIWKTYDLKTGKHSRRVLWDNLFPWIGDRFRELCCKWRVFRDRKILNISNPYN